MAAKLSVLLVDDHPVVCMGVKLLLEGSEQFEICGDAGDVATTRRLVIELRPDLIVLDLVLGGRDGLELVEEIMELHANTRILVAANCCGKASATSTHPGSASPASSSSR